MYTYGVVVNKINEFHGLEADLAFPLRIHARHLRVSAPQNAKKRARKKENYRTMNHITSLSIKSVCVLLLWGAAVAVQVPKPSLLPQNFSTIR